MTAIEALAVVGFGFAVSHALAYAAYRKYGGPTTASNHNMTAEERRDKPPKNPPDECEYDGCTETPKCRVHFQKPKDILYYCREHEKEANDFRGYKYTRTL